MFLIDKNIIIYLKFEEKIFKYYFQEKNFEKYIILKSLR